MKTNNFWSILVMLVLSVTVMFFTSCSSDDDEDGNKDVNVQEVVGTWTCTASTDKVDGKSITGYMVGESITINEDGKFSSTASSIGNGTWVLNGNKISAKNTSGDTFNATLRISGSTMKWDGTSSQGVSFNYTWKKN
ncbi:lipocalin family protein [Segatella copri]|uniref:lipocalin family protein n=1 Tax=Segatella copri TaxID=165179 RepID=UPI002916A92A|nr:lipocalin family protein [Segatella copri]MDV3121167.1 lipocalin family protein [Segatella copri]